ncbi:unnamed protein product [Paramecium octaurelia]|uniref:NFX1-type zinc finger-containing protein 1 n=1 Tax=Paramecium octaurelia TaxID=43137 RepID=A0A8S1TM95_PAROT|nr:unnamed protein product [Paramecium octaurelia]
MIYQLLQQYKQTSIQNSYLTPELEFNLQDYEIREFFIQKFDIEEIKCRLDNDVGIKQKLKYMTPIHKSFDYYYYLIKTIGESDNPSQHTKKYLEYLVKSQSFQNIISERCYLLITQANSIDNLEDQIEQLFQIFFFLKDIDINILQKSNISLIFTLQKIIEINYTEYKFNELFQKFDDFLILILNSTQLQQYKTIPAHPQPLECIQYRAENNQIFGQTNEQFENSASYLDFLFNFLREDYIYYIREQINYLSEKGFIKPIARSDTFNIDLYQDIKLIQFEINNLHIKWKIAIKQFDLDQRYMRDHIDWNYSNKLQIGSLICITNIECHPLLFGIIINRDKQQDEYEISNRINLEFRFLGPKSQIMEFLNLLSQQTILMDCKTEKQFEAQLYNLETIKKMQYLPQTNLILENQQPPYFYQNYLLSRCFSQLLSTCDKEQEKAMQLILFEKVAFIQGLPGTGKTYCATRAVAILNQRLSQVDKPILIVCYNNHTLDHFLEKLLQFIPADQIVRLGGNSKSAKINSYMFQSRSNLDFDQKEFKELKNQLKLIFNRLIQYDYTINAQDITRLWPELRDKLINDFLKERDLNNSQIDVLIQNQILNSWINVKPFADDRFLQFESKKFGLHVITQKEKITQQVRQNNVFGTRTTQVNDLQDYDQELSNQNEELLTPIEQFNKQNQNQSNLHYNFRGIEMIQLCLQDDTFNIWELNYEDIGEIIKYLKYLKYQEDCLLFEKTYKKYKKLSQTLQNLKDSYDLQKLNEYQVIGVTVTDAAYCSHILTQLNSKVLVVEEAEQILLSNLVTILTNNFEHVILFGNYFNLEEQLQNYDQTNYYFLKNIQNQKIPSVVLSTQRRMKTNIADFMRSINNQNIADHHDILETINTMQVKGLDSDFFIFNNEPFGDLCRKSKENEQEAEMIVQMVQYLIQAGNKESQITVLSLYQQQVQLIKEKFRNENQNQVRVETVDDYLGEENDIVIVSLIIINNKKKLCKSKYQNRIKTAFSRAKLGLYVFGYIKYSRQTTLYNSFLSKFLSLLQDKDYLKNYITLKCHIHGKLRRIDQSSHLLNMQGGCCCNNHTCRKQYLQNIQNQNDCQEICQNILPCRHQCQQRCQAQCICTTAYHCNLPGCNHIAKIQCGQDLTNFLCQQDLSVCFISTCKHTTKFKCYQKENFLYQCQHVCDKVLQCGHTCQKLCWENCQPCAQNIIISLYCGIHKIQKKCFEIQNHLINGLKLSPYFFNSKIGKEFFYRILESLTKGMIKDVPKLDQIEGFKCKIPCSRPRKCGHKFKCSNLCSQQCTPCEQVILITLKCGHKYQYLCKDVTVALKGLLPNEYFEKQFQCEHEKKQQGFENCIQCRDKIIKNLEEQIICKEKCIRKRSCRHEDPCLNQCCYECSPCLQIMQISLDCGHQKFVECFSNNTQCSQPCVKTRACEHYYPCSNYCSQPCSPCQVEIAITLPCGHLTLAKCHTVQTTSTGIVQQGDEQECGYCSRIY